MNKQCAGVLTLPNCITSLRIVGSVSLAFLKPFSVLFYVVYSICGLSDVLDGWIARATKQTSELGSKLDSIADLLFYSIMMIKIMPVLWRVLPRWIWIVVGIVLAIRLASYITAAVKEKKFASMHTIFNKMSGAAVFGIPYFILLPIGTAYCLLVAAITGVASTQELVLHLTK